MFLMTKCVTSAMGYSAVESMLLSSVATSIAFNTTVSTAGQQSMLCRQSSAIDHWSKKAVIVHVLHLHVKTGSSFNSKTATASVKLYCSSHR